jgi:pimeloyl-[acyl-carrier protein] methyl ester esterase
MRCNEQAAMSLHDGLHAVVSGRGRDLVLLHGWGMHAGIWDALVPALSQRFRVHAVDLPGHGASASCDPYTLSRIAAELARQMPSHCLVCGWSLGGQVALAWAGAAPQQVERLALVSTTPCFTQRADWPHALEAAVLQDFARALAGDYEATLKRFLALQAQGDAQARRIMQQLRASLIARSRPDVRALERGLQILRDTDMRGSIAAIKQPVMLIHGDRDKLTPLAAAEHLRDALPDARLAVMRGAAHAPFITDAAGFSAHLTEFMQ